MLTENDVVNYTANYLELIGYKIERKATTNQKGIDIIATTKNETLFIEAKGATSSKKKTKRFGKQFTNNQVSNHIAMAILYAMIELNTNSEIKFALALPDNFDHTEMIKRVSGSLNKLAIKVFFVSDTGKVRIA
jgi:Holliday junction resolvase-like predicted endonuclease